MKATKDSMNRKVLKPQYQLIHHASLLRVSVQTNQIDRLGSARPFASVLVPERRIRGGLAADVVTLGMGMGLHGL